jgi:hypothetical protein
MTQHYAMLQRNLIYTGVTRGKKLVVSAISTHGTVWLDFVAESSGDVLKYLKWLGLVTTGRYSDPFPASSWVGLTEPTHGCCRQTITASDLHVAP